MRILKKNRVFFYSLSAREKFDQKILDFKQDTEQMYENLNQEKKDLFQLGYQIMNEFSYDQKTYLFSKIIQQREQKLTEKDFLEKPEFFSHFKDENTSIWNNFSGGQKKENSQQQEGEIEEEKPEQTQFNVILTSYDESKKLQVIKTLKQVLESTLKEAKDFLDQKKDLIKEKIDKEQGEKIKEELEKIGCVIELKQLVILIIINDIKKQNKFFIFRKLRKPS